MTTFLQLHLLTSYPPACLNRDDLNRPKTAVLGGVPRLRVSSQSLKRAWRTSEVFEKQSDERGGIRTKELGRKIKLALLNGVPLDKLIKDESIQKEHDGILTEKQATEWSWMIVSKFVDKKNNSDEQGDKNDSIKEKGKEKKAKKSNVNKETLKSEQIVFYSWAEITTINSLILALREQHTVPTPKQLDEILVNKAGKSADLALFGRMLASSPDYNVEAACEVAHAISVNKVAVEDDFFTAVDDLNTREEDVGSAHIGEQGFAAGLFYLYICINRDLLIENLDGDRGLADNAIRALVESAATVAPTGKQKSFASRAWASYILAEKGSRQPRALSVAFLNPVKAGNMLHDAIEGLEDTRRRLDGTYYGWEDFDGKQGAGKNKMAKSLPSKCINALKEEGSLNDLLQFIIS
jgi:CRISPR system Cascade subunit CasC